MSAARALQPAAGDIQRASYRHALGRIPTGVAFAAARAPDGSPVGLLINSFTSVSMDPPLVSWCLALTARSAPVFTRATHFAISVLAENQQTLIVALKRPAEDRFSGVPIRGGAGDAPVLEAAAAAFECRVFSINRAGDHDIFIGEVTSFESGADEPLAYLGGRFGQVRVFA